MASPMHVYDVITKIDDYVNEEHEKKTYDEFESVKNYTKTVKDQKKQENGKFSLRNFRIQVDSANYINDEIIQNFFNNHYYHLGDILFEIPDLYESFKNYLNQIIVRKFIFYVKLMIFILIWTN